jgi:hypothetical protein
MPIFSKRHYEQIATTMQRAYADMKFPADYDYVVAQLSRTFAQDNSAFKCDRFERACVPGANVRARTSTEAADEYNRELKLRLRNVGPNGRLPATSR